MTFAIREGPQVFVDHVLIVGNVRTSTSTIERELQLKPGDPFSLGAINDSQRRLAALGLFRRARITELRHGDETTRDLLVTVEEAPPTTIGYGGGVEGGLRVVQSAENAVGDRPLRGRAARVLRDRPPQPVRQEPLGELFTSVALHPPQADDAGAHGIPPGRDVPRAAHVRHDRRRAS